MRFFALLNNQHVAALVITALIFFVLFAVSLGRVPMSGPLSNSFQIKSIQKFIDGIHKGDGPYPMIIALLIAGTIIWALGYILYYGFSEVII